MKTRIVPASELTTESLEASHYIEADRPASILNWAWSNDDDGQFSGTYATEAEAMAEGQQDFEEGALEDHDNNAVVSICVGRLSPVDPLEAMDFDDVVDRMSAFAHNVTGREEEWPPSELIPKLATHIAKFFEEHRLLTALFTIEQVVERKFRITWDEEVDDAPVSWEEGATRYRFTYKTGGELKESKLYKTAFEARKMWKQLNPRARDRLQRFEPVELFFPLDEEGKPVIPDDV